MKVNFKAINFNYLAFPAIAGRALRAAWQPASIPNAHSTTGEIVERTAPEYPDIKVKSNSPGTVTFTYPSGIPAGMHHLLVQYIVQAPTVAAPASPDACNKHIEIQKSPYTKDLTMLNSGQKLWGFAAWVDTRGVIHNWCPVFSCIIT